MSKRERPLTSTAGCGYILRYHGFPLEAGGWVLAPTYDVNPVAGGTGLTLNIAETDNALELEVVAEVAPLFRVKAARMRAILAEVTSAVGTWREVAPQCE